MILNTGASHPIKTKPVFRTRINRPLNPFHLPPHGLLRTWNVKIPAFICQIPHLTSSSPIGLLATIDLWTEK